jgi:hypothetical protein
VRSTITILIKTLNNFLVKHNFSPVESGECKRKKDVKHTHVLYTKKKQAWKTKALIYSTDKETKLN